MLMREAVMKAQYLNSVNTSKTDSYTVLLNGR